MMNNRLKNHEGTANLSEELQDQINKILRYETFEWKYEELNKIK